MATVEGCHIMCLQHRAVTKCETSIGGIFNNHEDMVQQPHPCSCGGDDASAIVKAVSRPGGDDEEDDIIVSQTIHLTKSMSTET